jgi:alpha-L-fucosidase
MSDRSSDGETEVGGQGSAALAPHASRLTPDGAHWFDTARFGLFIHWGHGSQHGWELSWPLAGGNPALPRCQNVGVAEYHASAQTFDPQRFDPRAWARLAKRCGMQYAILTTKHHDGFALYDTRLSDFSIMRTPHGKDIVRAFVDAFRAEGLRIGFYYSLSDWHHPDYPPFSEADKPYNFFALPQPTADQWQRYLDYLFGQIRELLTNYGQIDIVWFDGQWERTPEQWKPQELRALITSLQPGILINDRLPGAGDYDTPEQFVPAQPPPQRWETCMTMNESWAYNPTDPDYKSPRQLIHSLCEIAGKGGNFLLNIGPMGDGQLPPEQLERLEAIAAWMSSHADSIVGTTPGLEPWQFYGPSTRRGDRIYLHLLMQPYETITVRGLPIKRIRGVHDLKSAAPLPYTTRCAILDQLFNDDPVGEVTISIPPSLIDPYATVIAVDILAP